MMPLQLRIPRMREYQLVTIATVTRRADIITILDGRFSGPHILTYTPTHPVHHGEMTTTIALATEGGPVGPPGVFHSPAVQDVLETKKSPLVCGLRRPWRLMNEILDAERIGRGCSWSPLGYSS